MTDLMKSMHLYWTKFTEGVDRLLLKRLSVSIWQPVGRIPKVQVAVDRYWDKAYEVERDLEIGGHKDTPYYADVCDSHWWYKLMEGIFIGQQIMMVGNKEFPGIILLVEGLLVVDVTSVSGMGQK